MSTAVHVRTRTLNRTRFQTDAHPIPAPSCLGGAHRRCLLQADTCSCPCHRGVDLGPKPPAARPLFPCAACSELFDTYQARIEHFREAHPIVVSGHELDVHGRPQVELVAPDTWHRCQVCGRTFDTKNGLGVHAARHRRHNIATCTLERCQICYGDKPTPKPVHPRGIYRCRICDNQPFLSERSMLVHQAIAHGAPWPPKADR